MTDTIMSFPPAVVARVDRGGDSVPFQREHIDEPVYSNLPPSTVMQAVRRHLRELLEAARQPTRIQPQLLITPNGGPVWQVPTRNPTFGV
jgi:hypothetical protein